MPSRSFAVHGTVFLPCHNRWGEDLYHPTGGFDLDPVNVAADRTSGSPVLLTDDLFIGVLDPIAGGRFRSDGATIDVTPPPGGRLFVREGQDPYQSWTEYNRIIRADHGSDRPSRSSFFDAIEYCTWVEQKRLAIEHGATHPAAALTDEFVSRYLDRISALGLPPGKVTIDHGWSRGTDDGGVGDWEPEHSRFPDLSRTADAIRMAGHIPGLWLAVGRLSPTSRLRRSHPTLAGPAVTCADETPPLPTDTCYALPSEELADHYCTLFSRNVRMGFRKFKLDLHYGPKLLMRDQLALCYAAIKQADPSAEVEHHIPDIFASRYCGVVRTNDVLIAPYQWRGLVRTHWRVSEHSSPDRVLNLDHVGGNNPRVNETDYLTHWSMYTDQRGYPTLSLLPDHFSPDAVDIIREGLRTYHAMRAWGTRIE